LTVDTADGICDGTFIKYTVRYHTMLVDTVIKTAKPAEKPYKLTDGKGLYLLVTATGKYFRFDYRFNKKRKTLALGTYPDVSLLLARERLLAARKLLADGIDPSENKKLIKAYTVNPNTFEKIAREWHQKNKHTWTENHAANILSRLEAYIFPWLKEKPITEVIAPTLLSVLRRIEAKGITETAHRMRQVCGKVFRYAIACGLADRDPTADLQGALSPTVSKPMATITEPRKITLLLLAIRSYRGNNITRCALLLAPLTFVRPGELRHAEWSEINFDSAEWKIPAEKMKMRSPHIIPLSTQALNLLKELKPLTGYSRYVFPSTRVENRAMSENTVNAALRRMGYIKDEMTGHGFRAMASTLLHEQGWSTDVIERQMAHKERNSVKAAYNYAQHLPERKIMMQHWADYLETLVKNAGGIPIFTRTL